MIDFATNRRDLLKLASLGLTATALPAAHALSQSVAHGSAASLFDVRAYGGVGDGKTVDSPAFNRAIDAASARLIGPDQMGTLFRVLAVGDSRSAAPAGFPDSPSDAT